MFTGDYFCSHLTHPEYLIIKTYEMAKKKEIALLNIACFVSVIFVLLYYNTIIYVLFYYLLLFVLSSVL